jgi:hypothetical protein
MNFRVLVGYLQMFRDEQKDGLSWVACWAISLDAWNFLFTLSRRESKPPDNELQIMQGGHEIICFHIVMVAWQSMPPFKIVIL